MSRSSHLDSKGSICSRRYCRKCWRTQSKFTLNLEETYSLAKLKNNTYEKNIVLLKLAFCVNFNLLLFFFFFPFLLTNERNELFMYSTQPTLPRRQKINEIHIYIQLIYLNNNYMYLKIACILKLEI